MIELSIPGMGVIQLEHLVCDVNGTLALDGRLLEDLPRALGVLRDRLQIHMITADTHGRQADIDQLLGLESIRLTPGGEAEQKAAYVRQLGSARVAAIGQGANDALMLKEAAVGICVLSKEGTATASLLASNLVAPDIFTALELLEKPLRIVATLRK